jgi:hypothetical protein
MARASKSLDLAGSLFNDTFRALITKLSGHVAALDICEGCHSTLKNDC